MSAPLYVGRDDRWITSRTQEASRERWLRRDRSEVDDVTDQREKPEDRDAEPHAANGGGRNRSADKAPHAWLDGRTHWYAARRTSVLSRSRRRSVHGSPAASKSSADRPPRVLNHKAIAASNGIDTSDPIKAI